MGVCGYDRFCNRISRTIAIRPKGERLTAREFRAPIIWEKGEVVHEQDIAVFAVGHMMETAEAVCATSPKKEDIIAVTNQCALCQTAHLMDILRLIDEQSTQTFCVIEEGLLDGGYGEKIANYAVREEWMSVLQNEYSG